MLFLLPSTSVPHQGCLKATATVVSYSPIRDHSDAQRRTRAFNLITPSRQRSRPMVAPRRRGHRRRRIHRRSPHLQRSLQGRRPRSRQRIVLPRCRNEHQPPSREGRRPAARPALRRAQVQVPRIRWAERARTNARGLQERRKPMAVRRGILQRRNTRRNDQRHRSKAPRERNAAVATNWGRTISTHPATRASRFCAGFFDSSFIAFSSFFCYGSRSISL